MSIKLLAPVTGNYSEVGLGELLSPRSQTSPWGTNDTARPTYDKQREPHYVEYVGQEAVDAERTQSVFAEEQKG